MGFNKFVFSFWFQFQTNPAVFNSNSQITLFKLTKTIATIQQEISIYLLNLMVTYEQGTNILQLFTITSGQWYFLLLSQNASTQKIFLIDKYRFIQAQMSNTLTQDWTLDNTFVFHIGRGPQETTHFNGWFSQMGLVLNLSESNTALKFMQGIPELLFSLDFSEYELAQQFFNKILNSNYPYATNGEQTYTDIFDLDYVPNLGWSNRFSHQKIIFPQFREQTTPYKQFAFYLKYSLSYFNAIDLGWGSTKFGLFQRLNSSNQTVL